MRLFEQYFEILKENKGFSLQTFINTKKSNLRWKTKTNIVIASYDKVESLRKSPKFPCIIFDNVKLIYLRKGSISNPPL